MQIRYIFNQFYLKHVRFALPFFQERVFFTSVCQLYSSIYLIIVYNYQNVNFSING